MLGTGVHFSKSRNGDRFYSAANARRNRSNYQNLSKDQLKRVQSDFNVKKTQKLPDSDRRDGGVGVQVQQQQKDMTSVPRERPPFLSNFEQFLESVTPSVPAQYLSKTTMRGLRTCDVEFHPYFVLDDLWKALEEWSAYGAGVPLVLNDNDSVVQYYVPYLSGMQLYGNSSKSLVKSRPLGEDSDGDSFRDSCSDGSSDCEPDRSGFMNYSREQGNYRCQPTTAPLRMNQLSLRDHQISSQEGFSSDESEAGGSQGGLLFEYLERDQPYGREPLADKISQLALGFPDLKTLRSCDLNSSSWISVAWYPIYRIPVGTSLKDLDACFLTFHSLHTPLLGSQNVPTPVVTYPNEMDGVPKINLPVFGLAHYKFKPSLWIPNEGGIRQLLNSLLQDAENWLSSLQVSHPDFLFFHRRW